MVVGHIARWLRDEEAAGSNPATPTQVTGHSLPGDVAFIYAVQQQSAATLRAMAQDPHGSAFNKVSPGHPDSGGPALGWKKVRP